MSSAEEERSAVPEPVSRAIRAFLKSNLDVLAPLPDPEELFGQSDFKALLRRNGVAEADARAVAIRERDRLEAESAERRERSGVYIRPEGKKQDTDEAA